MAAAGKASRPRASLAAAAAKFLVAADFNRISGRFPKYWSRCFGSEHGGYFLRKDLLDHFHAGREEFKNEYVRFHGILSEPVGLVRGMEGNRIEYAWFNLERVYDNILDLGMRPIVEYSFMPAALASGDQTIFHWKGNVTVPKDYSQWENLIETVTRRLWRRYGKSEVRRWYFEVWNEPNLQKWFFAGSMQDYFRLYDHAAEAVKRVDPRLKVGGPATACAEWVREFIEHCRKENLARPGRRGTPVDFVSYHLYPTDPFFMEGEKMKLDWKGEAFFRESIHRNHAIVKSYRDMDLESHITEWNCSSNSRDPVHDGPEAAAFAVKAVQENAGCADTFSWWTLSDIFEEGGLPPAAFHGGFGLMTVDGLKKPSWFAFHALQELGEDLAGKPAETADRSAGCIPTRASDGSLRILFWAFPFPKEPNPPTRDVELTITGRKGTLVAERWLIDSDHSSIRREWERMGSPQSLTPTQVEMLKARNGMDMVESREIPAPSGRARYRFRLKAPSVAYLVIR